MKHVVMYSGGVGSWAAAQRLVKWHGPAKVLLLFADVIIEDWDLYRFLIETAGNIYGVEVSDLVARCRDIPPLAEVDARKACLAELRADANARIPGLRWIADGRTPWDVFRDVRFLGNHRASICSRVLKQEITRRWMDANLGPAAAEVHLGIDWTEEHRWHTAAAHWVPYSCGAPMCQEPLIQKSEMLGALNGFGIKPPRQYALEYPHANCSGACVKAGQAQWLHTLKVLPEVFRWSEAEEQAFRTFIGKDVAILRDRGSTGKCKSCRGAGRLKETLCDACDGTGKATRPLTLKELRENTGLQLDLFDWGGCGCFLGDEEVAASCNIPADD